jgi:acetyltransferase-like isoleucine patch superfamily enzyme
VTVGQGSVVGAGSLVTRSLPPYSIAYGVPAEIVGVRGEEVEP